MRWSVFISPIYYNKHSKIFPANVLIYFIITQNNVWLHLSEAEGAAELFTHITWHIGTRVSIHKEKRRKFDWRVLKLIKDRHTNGSTNEDGAEGGAMEWLARVWEKQRKSCLQSLKNDTENIYAVESVLVLIGVVAP